MDIIHFPPYSLPVQLVSRFLFESVTNYPAELGDIDFLHWPAKLAAFADVFCVKRTDDSLSAALFAYLNDTTVHIGYIPFICTLPECEKGTAYQLHEMYRKAAVSLGMICLRLEVRISNTHALNFYLRQGYVVTEERPERGRYLMECKLQTR